MTAVDAWHRAWSLVQTSALHETVSKRGEAVPTFDSVCVVGYPIDGWPDFSADPGSKQRMAPL